MTQSSGVPTVESPKSSYAAPAKNIADTAVEAGHLMTFCAALRVSGLADTLAAKGPYTVFAPSDEAFKKLPPGAYNALLKDPAKLRAILHYHVIPGYLMIRDLKSGETMTLQGTKLTAAVSAAKVLVNAACIVQADLTATNGVLHTIDAVMLPKGWQLLAVAA